MHERDAPRRRDASALGDRLLGAAVLGFVAGFVASAVAVGIFAAASHHPRHPSHYGVDVASLLGLWAGLLGAVAVATRRRAGVARQVRLGFALRLLPDLPLGIAAGLGAQFVLVPVLELVLAPFVPDLSHRLGEPAHALTAGVRGPGLVVLGLLVCLGSPIVEELFFRGLLLRGLLASLSGRLGRAAPAVAIGASALVFGLAHFEALQLLGLVGFGVVLGVLAWRTGRLGPGIVAHVAFNAATFVVVATGH